MRGFNKRLSALENKGPEGPSGFAAIERYNVATIPAGNLNLHDVVEETDFWPSGLELPFPIEITPSGLVLPNGMYIVVAAARVASIVDPTDISFYVGDGNAFGPSGFSPAGTSFISRQTEVLSLGAAKLNVSIHNFSGNDIENSDATFSLTVTKIG